MAMNEIGQIEIEVRELDRSVEFYRDKLGLTLELRTPAVAFFDCSGIRLLLRRFTGETLQPSRTIVYFKVSEFDQGLEFDREPHFVAHMPDHDLWLALLHDPDGHAIGLMQRKSRP